MHFGLTEITLLSILAHSGTALQLLSFLKELLWGIQYPNFGLTEIALLSTLAHSGTALQHRPAVASLFLRSSFWGIDYRIFVLAEMALLSTLALLAPPCR